MATKLEEAEREVAAAKAALEAWEATPDGKAEAEAEAAYEAARAARDLAQTEHAEALRAAMIDLGIRRGGTDGRWDDPGAYTEPFLAAVTKEVGATFAEAAGMPGVNSYQGGRVTGQELYARVLSHVANRIASADPGVKAARDRIARTRAAVSVAMEKLSTARRPRDVLQTAASSAERRLYEARQAQTIREKRTRAAATPERLVEAKARLLALDGREDLSFFWRKP